MKLLSTILFLVGFYAANAGGIDFFHGTYQEAIQEAQKQEKLLFVDAYTTWCGPCKRMSREVFTQSAAGELFNEYFVNVKIDMEKPNGREFGANYPVSAYPTLFFLDSNGKIIKKIVGGKSLQDLLALGSDIIAKHDFSTEFKKAYEAGDRSYENTIAYVNALNKSNKSSLKIANEFLLQNKDLSPQQKSDFIFAAASEVDSRIFELMIENKSLYIKQYGMDAFIEKVMKAAERTRNKAFEFESEELLDLAVKTVKKHNKAQHKIFLAETNMTQAVQNENAQEYLKHSKKLVKQLSSKAELISWAQKAIATFPKDDNISLFAKESLEKILSDSTDKNEITLYTQLLIKLKQDDAAMEYLNKANERVTDGATRKHISNLLEYLKRK